MYSVSKCAPQEALWNLDAAFQQFFRRCALKKQGKWTGKLGYPQFKTKKRGLGSFRLTGRIVVSGPECGDQFSTPGRLVPRTVKTPVELTALARGASLV
jgi:hypothetical protein